MRRTTTVGIVLLGVALTHGVLIDVAQAEQRGSLASVLGRLLKFKQREAVEVEVSPAPEARAVPQPERTPRAGSYRQIARLPEATSSSVPYPPLPPKVDQFWLRPAGHQQWARAQTTEETTVALPGRADLTVPSQVRQVKHVEDLAARRAESLPAEDSLVGNMPAAVRESVADELGQIEPVVPAKPLQVAPASQGRSPQTLAPVFHKVRGRIAAIDDITGIIRVDLLEEESLPVGTKIRAYHETESGESVAVHMHVLDSVAGVAAARLIDEAPLESVAPGDQTIAWKKGQ